MADKRILSPEARERANHRRRKNPLPLPEKFRSTHGNALPPPLTDKQKENEKVKGLLARWTRDPLLWVHDNFPTVKLSTQQEDFFNRLGDFIDAKIRVANGEEVTEEEKELAGKLGFSISAGQGVGKDFISALTVFWFMWCNPSARLHPKWNKTDKPKVVATGVNAKHLRNVLWSELSKIMMLSKPVDEEGHKPILKELFDWQVERLTYRDKRYDNWFAEAVTINANSSEEEQARTLYGRHAHSMMILADEAAGIADCVFTTMEGTMTDPVNFALMIFNSIKTKGYAIRSQGEESGKWIAMRWDAEESELVSRESIERKRKYGEDSYEWRVLVKGLPPLVEHNTLIPPDWILNAIDRDLGEQPDRGIVQGGDIGGGGDRSVSTIRHGDRIFPQKLNSSADSTILEDWLCTEHIKQQAGCTVIDNIGIGAGVYFGLRKRVTTRRGDARNVASNPERFYNRRAEVYWTLREKFEAGVISIPNDSELINELSSIIYDPANKSKIGDKKELRRKLGGSSPDKADSLALSYYVDDTQFIGGKTQSGGRTVNFDGVFLR